MAIQRLRKENKILLEEDIDAFIQKGGSTRKDCMPQEGDVRMTLRLPSKIVEQLDAARKERPGFLSRNTYIVQLLQKGLQRKAR